MEEKRTDTMIKGTVRFVNEDDRKQNKYTVTIAVEEKSKQRLESLEIPVKRNVHDGKTYDLVHFPVYSTTEISDFDGEHKWEEMPLKYGDVVIAKVASRKYEYMGKKGISCRLLALYVQTYARRGGFTEDELKQLRSDDMGVPF
jgi:hypothetical protein|nr:MAG TPA: hypothetical protein [Caudoviricetes sp.]